MTAEAAFKRLQAERSSYLRRAIDCSSLTIPSLIPESDENALPGLNENNLPSLYQGVGARAVNSLSAKLLLALMPPNQPFFRLTIDAELFEQALDGNNVQGPQRAEAYSKTDELLSKYERRVLWRLDMLQARTALFEAIKHLLVGGNAALYVGQDFIRMYPMRSYVCHRDVEGNVTEAVICEMVAPEYLPEGVKPDETETDGVATAYKPLYTHVTIDPDQGERAVEWYQECYGKTVPGSAGFSRVDTSPWLFLRLNRVAGESYGRGVVEDVLGDLNSLEQLSQAIVEGSLAAAALRFLVNPNGVTRADVIANSQNGDFVSGDPDDVKALQAEKSADLSIALNTAQMIERRIGYTFLLNESVQRDAERVTAEEIRLMAEQLEQGLGGLYSMLSAELQLPLIRRVMKLLKDEGSNVALPEGLVEPQITTGLDAIGRGNDRARLTQFLQTISAALGPEQFQRYINMPELVRRFAASDGIDSNGLVKDEQQLAQEDMQQQAMMIAQMQQANGSPSPQGPAPAGAPAGAPGGAGGPVPG